MRPIPTRVHGVLDYLTGILLIVSPWLFDFANGEMAQWIPIVVGAAILLVSLITDYELSLIKRVPVPTHLAIDIMGGALLAVSPWLFGFAELVYWPHLVIGLAEIGAGLLTRQVPDYRFSSTLSYEDTVESKDSKVGEVIEIPDDRASTEERRNMDSEEELTTHEQEKERQRAADVPTSRSDSAEHLPG